MKIQSLCALSGCLTIATATNNSTAAALPVVDLGYEIQRATTFNKTGNYYSFNNIRYAAPPTGQNRFRGPQPPALNRSGIQTGEQRRMCAQAIPSWLAVSTEYIPQYLKGQTIFNDSSFNFTTAESPPPNPSETEDCLFLDVAVPKQLFDKAGNHSGAPVLVWIYGGGFTVGDKSMDPYHPAGLLAASQNHGHEGLIYVAFNYRLGAFGFLAGPTFQQDNTTTANAGLQDQRFALEWIQQNIHLFGGDPNRVTVFGESAGGGSILYQMTAYGGSQGYPFQQAIPQSPYNPPIVTNQQSEIILEEFLDRLNVTSIEEARTLPFEALSAANLAQVEKSSYAGFGFGPAVDGEFVTALPIQYLARGQFDKRVKILAGHNADEGLLLTSPFNRNDSTFRDLVIQILPPIQAYPSELHHITEALYPAVFDGSHGYMDQISRAATFLADVLIVCNANVLDRTLPGRTYSYEFSVPPALHGEDLYYTFANGPGSTMVKNDTVAAVMQSFIANFAITGDPNGPGVPTFPRHGGESTVLNLNISNIEAGRDTVSCERCRYWQKVLWA